MRIFILGSSGMLGTYLKSFLQSKYELICPNRKDVDFCDNEKNIKKFFKDKNICANDVIINAAGIIKQRKPEVIEMIKVNSLLPHILSDIKDETDCKVIHITTDCVFSGKKGKYLETDIHDCEDDYGKSKSLGESKNLTIIRTSIIGEELNNKLSLCEWVKSQNNKTINGFTNHYWNGVTCLELSKIIDDIIQKNNYWLGVRHLHSPDIVSKYELVSIIGKYFNINFNLIPVQSNICFRDLSSIYKIDFAINSIEYQVKEMSEYKIKNT